MSAEGLAAAFFCLLASQPDSHVIVEVVPASSEVQANRPIEVTVRISIPAGEQLVPRTMCPPSYYLDFVVRDRAGKRLPFEGSLVNLDLDPNDTVLLKPDRDHRASFDLAKLYPINSPGVYQVVAVYGRPPMPGLLAIGPVRSATIAIRVLQK